MKQRILASLTYRINTELAPQSPVKFLAKLDIEEAFSVVIPVLYLYTRSKDKSKQIYMNELICAIGHTVRSHFNLKKDSALAAKSGAFILYTFEECGILRVALGASRGKHASYVVEVLHDEHIVKMWEGIPVTKTEKLPSLTPYPVWTASKHESGAKLVKTRNSDVLQKLTPETHPIVFEVVNKAQEVGWCINESVYKVIN